MCCKVVSGLGATLEEQGNALYIWTWGCLVQAAEGVGVGSDMRGIEVRGCFIVGKEVGNVASTTLGSEVGGVDGTTLGTGTGDGRAMESIHWKNRSRSSVIASIWVVQVTMGASVIAHVRMNMACMMRSSGSRESSMI